MLSLELYMMVEVTYERPAAASQTLLTLSVPHITYRLVTDSKIPITKMQFLALLTIAASAFGAVARPGGRPCADTQISFQSSQFDLTALTPDAVATQVCWRACFPKKPECPATMKPEKLGDCWTCCKEE